MKGNSETLCSSGSGAPVACAVRKTTSNSGRQSRHSSAAKPFWVSTGNHVAAPPRHRQQGNQAEQRERERRKGRAIGEAARTSIRLSMRVCDYAIDRNRAERRASRVGARAAKLSLRCNRSSASGFRMPPAGSSLHRSCPPARAGLNLLGKIAEF